LLSRPPSPEIEKETSDRASSEEEKRQMLLSILDEALQISDKHRELIKDADDVDTIKNED